MTPPRVRSDLMRKRRAGVFKRAALHEEIADAGFRFAADRDAMAVQKSAVGHGHIFRRLAADPAAFERDVVVAGVDRAAANEHVAGVGGIDAVGVRRIRGREDGHVFDQHLAAMVRHEMKHGRVAQRDALDLHARAVAQDDEVRARNVERLFHAGAGSRAWRVRRLAALASLAPRRRAPRPCPTSPTSSRRRHR